ncbi:hypothetical protein HYW35_02895 [Candidatus Saccharibacteria bacterium]|nr:hypothetical protein [Candidatus Saccharibacteria bacterium]
MDEDGNDLKTETSTDQKTVKNKKKWPLWRKIAAVVAVVLVALFIIVNVATSGVAKVSNQFLKDVQSKNADAAYSLLTKEAVAATDKDKFKTIVDQAGPILNAKTNMTSKEASGETGKAGTGKVVYEIKGTDGVTYVVTINLQKEDGKWKVLNFESTQKK